MRTPLLATVLLPLATGCGDDSHAHDHDHGDGHVPHVVARIDGPLGEEGVAHVKLHDDVGDVELWIWGEKGVIPASLPLDTEPRLTLVGLGADGGDRAIALGVRDEETNADEAGEPTIVDGRTNYFVYPSGDEDSAWLAGEDFACEAWLAFDLNGRTWTSERFTLVPHSHEDGH